MRLAVRLGNRMGGQGWRRKMDQILQPQTPTFRPWRQTPNSSQLAGKRRNSNQSAGAQVSLDYTETCPKIDEYLKMMTFNKEHSSRFS